jgi:hypothetical protein
MYGSASYLLWNDRQVRTALREEAPSAQQQVERPVGFIDGLYALEER